MFPVGKKMGPAMRRVLRPIHRCSKNRLAAGSRHAIDRFVDIGGKENNISRPRSSSPVGCARQADRRTSGEVQPLELLVSKETDGFSVWGPEGELAALRAG